MQIDLSRLDEATRGKVDEIFRQDFDLRVLKAVERQTRIAARNYLHRPRAKEGFGERVLEVDAVVDGLWRQFYGHNYSEDKDLVKFLVKRNPEIAVRCQGTRIQVGYSAEGRGSKLSKRYHAESAEARRGERETGSGGVGVTGMGAGNAPALSGANGAQRSARPT